jgi:hypothetical protein
MLQVSKNMVANIAIMQQNKRVNLRYALDYKAGEQCQAVKFWLGLPSNIYPTTCIIGK